jgi:hypothetical protein
LSRAEKHFKSVDVDISNVMESKPYFVALEYDAKESKYLCRVRKVKPLPQEHWALVIGDCVHNARSALDYIAWRLAGSKLSDRNTMWPIFETPEGFAGRGLQRLSGIHPDARAEIVKLQPYNEPNPQLGACPSNTNSQL